MAYGLTFITKQLYVYTIEFKNGDRTTVVASSDKKAITKAGKRKGKLGKVKYKN